MRGPRKPGGGSGGFDKIPEFDLGNMGLSPIKGSHIAGIISIGLAIWLLTGFYRVELQEKAVVMIFGVNSSITEPGLHWNLPSPIGKVVKLRTEEIKRVEIGFRSGRGQTSQAVLNKESIMLTEGANMIDIQMAVQYKISDPAKFLFNTADSFRQLRDRGLFETAKDVSEAALREVVGTTEIDSILTVGKSKVQQDVQNLIQRIFDKYDMGLSVELVQLLDVHPPGEVKASFRDVNNAEEDKSRLIREAEGYRNSLIPEARGQAAQVIARAEAYRAEKIARSKGDATRFISQLTEYKKAPKVTKKRLYLETMEEVLSKVEKIVIDPQIAKSALPLLNIGPDRSKLSEVVK